MARRLVVLTGLWLACSGRREHLVNVVEIPDSGKPPMTMPDAGPPASCRSDADCDDANVCTRDVCNGDVGCAHVALDRGPCDDGDPCTVNDTCAQGKCEGGAFICACHTDSDCGTVGLCRVAHCTQGNCRAQTAADGAACDDGDACTTGDACQGGVCVPGAMTCQCRNDSACDDGNVCTVDRCQAGQCVHTPEVSACDDGNACTANDTCVAGACTPGAWVCACQHDADCDDGNPCTADTCAAGSCVHAGSSGASCDDGDPCTSGDACQAGLCHGNAYSCSSSNPCVARTCDGQGGCTTSYPSGNACDDGDSCTGDGSCLNGVCQKGARVTCPMVCNQSECNCACGTCPIYSCTDAASCCIYTPFGPTCVSDQCLTCPEAGFPNDACPADRPCCGPGLFGGYVCGTPPMCQ
jgi:hypothetical protein